MEFDHNIMEGSFKQKARPICKCGRFLEEERTRTELTQWYWCPWCKTKTAIPIMFL